MSRTYSYDLNNLRTNGNYFTWNIWNAFNVFDLYMGSGGGSGGSVAENSEESRSGEQAAGENGETRPDIDFTFRLKDGQEWSKMTDAEKNALLYEANQKLGELSEEKGFEWIYTIVQGEDYDGSYIRAMNFRTNNKTDRVSPDLTTGISNEHLTILGTSHYHPTGDYSFSVGDYQSVITSVRSGHYGHNDVIANGFTSIVVVGFYKEFRSSFLTVESHSKFFNATTNYIFKRGEAMHHVLTPVFIGSSYKDQGFRISNNPLNIRKYNQQKGR